MAAKAKPAPEHHTQARVGSLPAMIAEWVRQGAEGFIATQKIMLDLAAQQNALALTIVRERLGSLRGVPVKTLMEFAGKGVENFMELQKILLDLAARQNAIVADGTKPGWAGTRIEPMAEVVRQSIDNLIDAQKHFLHLAEKHTEAAIRDVEDGKMPSSTHLEKLARDGMKNFLESQKKFLDIVEQEAVIKKPASEPVEGRICMADMAKETVDSLIEAQKRLLDLASSQIDVNVKFAKDVFSPKTDEHPTTAISEVMRKSVDSFAAAQKALMELASKPRRLEGEAAQEHEAVGAR